MTTIPDTTPPTFPSFRYPSRWKGWEVEGDLGSPTLRFRRIEKYTRDQGCTEPLIRELGQILQPAVPEDRFQHDAGILNQPVLEITAFTPATTGSS